MVRMGTDLSLHVSKSSRLFSTWVKRHRKTFSVDLFPVATMPQLFLFRSVGSDRPLFQLQSLLQECWAPCCERLGQHYTPCQPLALDAQQWWSLICGSALDLVSMVQDCVPVISFWWYHNIWVLGCLGVCAQMRKSCPRWSIGPGSCGYQALAAGLGLRRAVLAPFSTCRALDRSRLQRKGMSNHVGLCWFIGLLTWLVLFRLFHTIPKS